MRLASSARRFTERPMPAYEWYEDGGRERRAAGAVDVGRGAWWSATLSVPLNPTGLDDGGAPAVVFLHVERHGHLPDAYRGGVETMDLSLPASELAALLALLVGLVAQGRRDGVLPPTDAAT